MTDTPTPADRGRDLERDLATCGAATPGPLKSQWGCSTNLPHKVWSEQEIIARFYREQDAIFMASAREGWPAAIRRALAAEAEAKRLKVELAEARRVCGSLAARAAAQSDLLTARAEAPAPERTPPDECPGHERGGTRPPCCDRAGEYNGYGSDGPLLFRCPKGCSCHD